MYSQSWPKVYGNIIEAKGKKVIETYDKGMIIASNIEVNNYDRFMWLIKTDINGEILWEKRIGGGYRHYIDDINQTHDGGAIMIFRWSKYDLEEDPVILKMDACYNVEWCKVLHTEGFNRGVKVIQTPDSSYIALSMYHSPEPNERIFLFKLNKEGDVLWSHLYAQLNPGISIEEGFYLSLLPNDSSYLITGACKYIPTGGTNSMWIKVTKDGNEIYDVIWNDTTYDSNDSYGTVHYPDHYCSIGSRGYNLWDWSPEIFKLSNNGDRLGSYRISNIDTSASGSTISIYKDTMFVIGGRWEEDTPPFQGHCEIFLTDTIGNVIRQRTLFDNLQSPRNTIITYDNKILALCGFVPPGTSNWDTYLFKLNDKLEDDTLYNIQLNYDSLCPGNIVSDTFSLYCDVWVKIEEPLTSAEGSQMKIYPNPAKDRITIKIPEYVVSEQQTDNFEVTKANYLRGTPLKIYLYDVFGRLEKIINVAANHKEVLINVSDFMNGLYLAVLRDDNRIIGSSKFLVKH
jgi:hypothetical protein